MNKEIKAFEIIIPNRTIREHDGTLVGMAETHEDAVKITDHINKKIADHNKMADEAEQIIDEWDDLFEALTNILAEGEIISDDTGVHCIFCGTCYDAIPKEWLCTNPDCYAIKAHKLLKRLEKRLEADHE